MKFLGIDPGKKYSGLAMADGQIKIAMPYKVLDVKNQNSLFKRLKEIVKKEKIEKIVVGRPIGMSGRVTEQTKVIDQFIKDLKKHLNVPIISFDERLSSKMADKFLGGATSRRGRTSNHAVAASIILQNFLDHERISSNNQETITKQ